MRLESCFTECVEESLAFITTHDVHGIQHSQLNILSPSSIRPVLPVTRHAGVVSDGVFASSPASEPPGWEFFLSVDFF